MRAGIGFVEIITVVGVAATIIQTVVYLVVTFRAERRAMDRPAHTTDRPPRRLMLGMAALTLVSIGASVFNYYDRRSYPIGYLNGPIQEYGVGPYNSLYVKFDSSLMDEYKTGYKAGLVLHAEYSNIDKMTDPAIGKSDLYTIIGGPQVISVLGFQWMRPPSLNAGDYSVSISYSLVVIPNGFTMDQVKNLADIARIGGKIIASPGRGDVFHQEVTNLPAAPPLSQAPPTSPAAKPPGP